MSIDRRGLAGGVAMLLFCGGFILASQAYPMGTPRQMGPAYFPTLFGSLGVAVGLLLVIQALRRPLAAAAEPVAWRPLVAVLASIAAFGLIFALFGLAPAVIATVLVSALADRDSRPLEAVLLGVGLAVACWLVFALLLRLPFPILRAPW